ncbi:MAG: CBS domain-containing protein [Gammaproteobacteria bacterium]|nr:MAG: CBS domain-containing protein [Gammaproteobacteria bacterium]
MILVRDHMKPAVHVFNENTSVEEIVQVLIKSKISGGPVINDNKELLGYVTEQDCIKQMLNDSYYCEEHQIASDIMRQNPLFVSPDEDIVKIAEMMANKKPKQYPVVEDGKVVGIITRAEVLNALNVARIKACGHK